MLRKLFFLCVVILFSGYCFGNKNLNKGNKIFLVDSTQIRLITVSLMDGTKIWGEFRNDSAEFIYVMDFNLGFVLLNNNNIASREMVTINSAVIIETANGSSYFGQIIEIGNGVMKINSLILGLFEIQTNTITKITPSDEYISRKGETWFVNPNATRYFFAPSAIPLKKKESYFQNAYLLSNSINIGITDNITLGGGVVIPFLFYITPKISFKAAKNIYLGGGILFTQSFISDIGLSAGIGYGLATYGNMEHNFTIGVGYGFAQFNNEYRPTPMPIVTLNGMTRISKKMALVSENWLMPRGGYNKEVTIGYDLTGAPIFETIYENKDFYSTALSFGIRLMPGLKTSVDFAVVSIRGNPGSNDFFIPYLDFVYKF